MLIDMNVFIWLLRGNEKAASAIRAMRFGGSIGDYLHGIGSGDAQ